ncbi:hypothetical protein CVT26_015231, partial [Gymnopilus dilepis]
MPGRESFQGLRKSFLENERQGYKNAVANGTKDDFVMDVVRRFLKRFPIDLDDDKEPTAKDLASVDDAAPDEERVAPDPQDYAEDQTGYNIELEKFENVTKRLEFRAKQIARWFNYRLNKDDGQKGSTKQNGKQKKALDLNDPMTVFTLRLMGKDAARPRKSTDYNLWANDNKSAVEEAYSAAGVKSAGMDLKTRTEVTRKLFAKESESVRKAYAQRAQEEHEDTIKQWEEACQRPASIAPESHQICIDGIATTMQPALDALAEFTGMRVTLLAGGPEPAAGGRLNIIGRRTYNHSSLHSGGTKGPISLRFPEAEPEKYHNQVIAAFSDFLRKCYSREDCQSSALKTVAGSKLECIKDKDLFYTPATGENYGTPESISQGPSNAQAPGTAQASAAHAPATAHDPAAQDPATTQAPATVSSQFQTSSTTLNTSSSNTAISGTAANASSTKPSVPEAIPTSSSIGDSASHTKKSRHKERRRVEEGVVSDRGSEAQAGEHQTEKHRCETARRLPQIPSVSSPPSPDVSARSRSSESPTPDILTLFRRSGATSVPSSP